MSDEDRTAFDRMVKEITFPVDVGYSRLQAMRQMIEKPKKPLIPNMPAAGRERRTDDFA